MKNVIIEVGATRWLVREAVSEDEALSAIAMARVSGSVGAKNTFNETYVGGKITVLADVVQINSDNTVRQPHTEAY
jgi:hypothetical protein